MKTVSILIVLVALMTTAPLSFAQSSYKIPSEDWSLQINLDGFKVQKEGLSADKSTFRLSAINKRSNQNLSIFIEKADAEGDKIACRDYYWSKAEKSPLPKENLKKHETDLLALVEFDTREFNGQVINFHNLNAYLAKKGYWIDVHISKVGYTKKDEKQFEEIWRSISIKEDK